MPVEYADPTGAPIRAEVPVIPDPGCERTRGVRSPAVSADFCGNFRRRVVDQVVISGANFIVGLLLIRKPAAPINAMFVPGSVRDHPADLRSNGVAVEPAGRFGSLENAGSPAADDRGRGFESIPLSQARRRRCAHRTGRRLLLASMDRRRSAGGGAGYRGLLGGFAAGIPERRAADLPASAGDAAHRHHPVSWYCWSVRPPRPMYRGRRVCGRSPPSIVSGVASERAARRALKREPGFIAGDAAPFWREMRPLAVWATVGAMTYWIYNQSYNYVLAEPDQPGGGGRRQCGSPAADADHRTDGRRQDLAGPDRRGLAGGIECRPPDPSSAGIRVRNRRDRPRLLRPCCGSFAIG